MDASDVKALLRHPNFPAVVLKLAAGFREISDRAPGLASLFATQQRWLLSHAVLALYFESLTSAAPGFTRSECIAAGTGHGLTSRNTAAAFFDVALKYRVIEPASASARGRNLRAIPSANTLAVLMGWYLLHLGALDLLDGRDRQARFAAGGAAALAAAQPQVARRLLAEESVRKPGPIYAILTWMDEGGILMDRLISGTDARTGPDAERLITDVASVSALSRSFNLSRTHTGRKLAAVEAIGGLGWTKARGRSPIWISRGFFDEYAAAQATKLAIVSQAFEDFARYAPERFGAGATAAKP